MISKRLSIGQQMFRDSNPEYYRSIKSKAGKESVKSNKHQLVHKSLLYAGFEEFHEYQLRKWNS
ncbi:hypothetical protein LCGC14_1449520 [marine sediment metagenome]|uniref:Uncharacterized protein n=1 Tax=marine sediment metagenome TaxID=412755 RepID=A0A0F9JI68_9ZZZZ